MADLKLDASGDLAVEDDNLVILTDDSAIAQNLSIRLKFFKGEWFLDLRIGVPYYQQILIKNPSLTVVRSIFREVILETAGIASISFFDLSVDSAIRLATLRFTALKDDGGTLDFSEEFIIG